MAGTKLEQASTLYRNTYNSIAGVDIKAVFFGVSFGNLQAVSYSITREKAPVYTMGSPECRGYARGKRAIAGNLVFVMFDDHALLGAINKVSDVASSREEDYKFVSDFDEIRPMSDNLTVLTGNNLEYNNIQNRINNLQGASNSGFNTPRQAYNSEEVIGTTLEENWGRTTPWYSDQIPSFNIVLTGVNEDGFAATMSVLGVEILNEGYGISIDDLISEQQMTYVARAIARWRKVPNNFSTKLGLSASDYSSSGVLTSAGL